MTEREVRGPFWRRLDARARSEDLVFVLLALVVFTTAAPARTAEAAETARARPPSVVVRRVSDRLQEDPALAKRHLKVEASGLVLTVSGWVGNESERRKAIKIARENANPHMIVSDSISSLPPPPKPASESRAAQWRIVRNGAPRASSRPPPPRPPARR